MTAPFSQGFPSDFSLKKIFPFADKSINIPILRHQLSQPKLIGITARCP